MTFEKILTDLSMDTLSAKDAYNEVSKKDKMKRIIWYSHLYDVNKEPLTDSQLQELESIVYVLQALYNSGVGSPVGDSTYDCLQEMLVDMGIPRLSGSIEINDSKKVSHRFTNLRGTLDKVYYLTRNEIRTNKSRKYLDDWLNATATQYEKATGKSIDMNSVKIVCQPKFDGTSAILEWDGKQALWLTRGDTSRNRASDISHIMRIFNDLFCGSEPVGIKFEVMMTEENKDKINELYKARQYKNSRQIVTATINAAEPDFKVDYLYPVPLRIMHPGDSVEQIHPMMFEKFPTMICTFADREKIRDFANAHRYVEFNGMRMRTDGVVMTIVDERIQLALGRNNDINNFEIAYKFTEESAHTRVKNVEFYVSEFGYVTPVLVVNDVILKGNTINHISLSNKERFDELDLSYGDEVKVLYDIIPYATVDATCIRQKVGRKIEFVKQCPRCHEDLDLNVVQVQCKNPNCPSRIVGRIMNYCNGVRIQNIGYQTLDTMYSMGLLKNGIRSLYKLKKKTSDIENLDGFGKLKTRKMISEIEAKRRLQDYEFFGSIGIEGLSSKTFRTIFSTIKLSEFLDMINLKNFDLLAARLVQINGIGDSKAEAIVSFFSDIRNLVETRKLLEEVSLSETFSASKSSKGRIVFTGCRPDDDMIRLLNSNGYEASNSWSNSAKYLVVPNYEYDSSKVTKARERNIPIVPIGSLRKDIPGLK